MEYYFSIKKKEIMRFAESEWNWNALCYLQCQLLEVKYCVFSHKWSMNQQKWRNGKSLKVDFRDGEGGGKWWERGAGYRGKESAYTICHGNTQQLMSVFSFHKKRNTRKVPYMKKQRRNFLGRTSFLNLFCLLFPFNRVTESIQSLDPWEWCERRVHP